MRQKSHQSWIERLRKLEERAILLENGTGMKVFRSSGTLTEFVDNQDYAQKRGLRVSRVPQIGSFWKTVLVHAWEKQTCFKIFEIKWVEGKRAARPKWDSGVREIRKILKPYHYKLEISNAEIKVMMQMHLVRTIAVEETREHSMMVDVHCAELWTDTSAQRLEMCKRNVE